MNYIKNLYDFIYKIKKIDIVHKIFFTERKKILHNLIEDLSILVVEAIT